MKGTIILKPLEYTIEAIGEKWLQGDKLTGSLKIKNQSAEKIELPSLRLVLCEGLYKKVKAKDAKGWSAHTELASVKDQSINPDEERVFPFEFKLAENSTITDKTGSLYLALFEKDEALPLVNIELAVEPKLVIKEILKIFENFLRFKVKEIKSGKGMVDVKLVPPTSRELSNVDGLLLSISEIEKNLTLKYLFNHRVLNISGATMQSEKATKEMEHKFTPKQYLIYGDSINQDFIVASVNEVLSTVKTKML